MINSDRVRTLMVEFEKALPVMIKKYPNMYAFPLAEVSTICARITASISRNSGVGGCDINSPIWRASCKALGIKHTKKAINAYLQGE